MEAEIDGGYLYVRSSNPTEAYALEKWHEDQFGDFSYMSKHSDRNVTLCLRDREDNWEENEISE